MRRSAKVLVGALTLVLAGCGIPDETDVQVVKPGPPPGFATDSAAGLAPPLREAAATKDSFVENFLKAAAGESDKAYERVRKYLSEGSQDELKEQSGPVLRHVVRVTRTVFTENGAGAWTVTLTVQQVGVLGENGTLESPVLRDTTYSFTVGGGEAGEGWYVSGRIPPLLLSTRALEDYYEIRTIYFWSSDLKVLVPDARYMLRATPQEAEPTEIVDWLTAGPSAWLTGAVRPLPTGTNKTENVPTGDRLEVSLSADAAAPQSEADATEPVDGTDLLGRQLMWSLRPYLRTELVLKIEGQQQRTFTADTRYLEANPAQGLSETPEQFAVLGGRIYRLARSPNGGADPLPTVLANDNDGIVAAALARDGNRTAAALVTAQAGRVRLRVGSAVGGGTVTYNNSKWYGQMGRPVWLRAPVDGGLIVVDGALYRFGLDSAELTRVGLPDAVTGAVQAVGAAPDGRRIAVVAGGRLYLVGLTRGDGGVQVQGVRLVPTTLGQLTGVDWTSETELVVAGTQAPGKVVVLRFSLDGALVRPDPDGAGAAPVTSLAAYPDSPLRPSARSKVMYATGAASYDLEGGDEVLEPSEVVGAPAGTEASAMTAPFFMTD